MKNKRIGDIKKKLHELGIDWSVDQIRKLEKAGIVFSKRAKSSNYREFNDTNFDKSIHNMLLYYFGVSIKDIKDMNNEVIQRCVKRVFKLMKELAKQ